MMTTFAVRMTGTFASLLAPFRRASTARKTTMDAATYAAMVAEAERIAAPYRRHVAGQLAALQAENDDAPGGDFRDVEALLDRAGLITH